MRNRQLAARIILVFHFVIFEPALLSRADSSFDKELPKHRGGVPLEEKKALFQAGSVTVDAKLQHLLFAKPGALGIRGDFNYEEAAVCTGGRNATGPKYFMCPTEVPAEVAGKWAAHADMLASEFYKSQTAKVYCCGFIKEGQHCCDYTAFRKHIDQSKVSLFIILIVLGVMFAIASIVLGLLIYCFCCRK